MNNTHVGCTAFYAKEAPDWVSLRMEFGVPSIGGYFDFSSDKVHLTICSTKEECWARLLSMQTAVEKAIATFGAPEAPEETTNAEGN